MKKTRHLRLFFVLLGCILFSSCSSEHPMNVDYSFEVAQGVAQEISDFHDVEFNSFDNINLGFYKGNLWIKLEIATEKQCETLMVNPNLTHDEFKLYDFN